MQHVYYFYKPSSEYPVVDPMLSIQCYLSALDKCYAKYKTKADSKGIGPVSLDSFNGVLFHTPYCKLVQKSLARLSLNDYLDTPEDVKASKHPELEKMRDTKLEESYFDRDVEKAFMAHSQNIFESKTKPGFKVAANVGNMYTPCLYGGLVSYMISKPPEELARTLCTVAHMTKFRQPAQLLTPMGMPVRHCTVRVVHTVESSMEDFAPSFINTV